MKKRLWLSFDLGLKGDYDLLYAWLDESGARECGESLATFSLEVDDRAPDVVVREQLKKRKIKLTARDRIYLIWLTPEKKARGKFISGSRRRAPWAGSFFAEGTQSEESDD